MAGNANQIGGSATGPTGLCHESSAAIAEAAIWYAAHLDTCEHPIVPALRRRFGLSATEAVIAIQEARKTTPHGNGFGGRG